MRNQDFYTTDYEIESAEFHSCKLMFEFLRTNFKPFYLNKSFFGFTRVDGLEVLVTVDELLTNKRNNEIPDILKEIIYPAGRDLLVVQDSAIAFTIKEILPMVYIALITAFKGLSAKGLSDTKEQ